MRYCHECIHWNSKDEFCSKLKKGKGAYDSCGSWTDGKQHITPAPDIETILNKTRRRKKNRKKSSKPNNIKVMTPPIPERAPRMMNRNSWNKRCNRCKWYNLGTKTCKLKQSIKHPLDLCDEYMPLQ